jgi:hypothetical protein
MVVIAPNAARDQKAVAKPSVVLFRAGGLQFLFSAQWLKHKLPVHRVSD